MRRLSVALLVLAAGLASAQYPGAAPAPREWKRGFGTIAVQDAQAILNHLAGPDYLGRSPSQPGYAAAAGFCATWLRENGLAPAAPNGSYFQRFTVQQVSAQADASVLETKDGSVKLEFLKDFAWSPQADFDREIPVVFARVAKGASLSGLDRTVLKGALVILATDTRDNDPAGATELVRAGSDAGLGLIQVVTPVGESTPLSSRRVTVVKDVPSTRAVPVVGIAIRQDAAKRLAAALGAKNFLADSPAGATFELGSQPLVIRAKTTQETSFETLNVLAKIEGSDPKLKAEAIVIGSHLDHMGTSERGTFWGADDNASGCTANMLIARAIAQNPVKPKRTVIFALWSCEELGLYGSIYYAAHPVMPLESTVAYLNMDMVGRDANFGPWNDQAADNTNAVYVGIARLNSPDLDAIVRDANRYVNLLLREDKEDRTFRSDTGSFVSKGVPSLKAFTGEHEDYHRMTDTPDKINFAKLVNVAKWLYLCTETLASGTARPRFEAGARYLTGSVTPKEKLTLSPGAVVEVELVDVTAGEAAAKPLDKTVIRAPGSSPFRFALKYRPTEVAPSGVYEIRATVIDGGKRYVTTTPVRVLAAGQPTTNVQVPVEGKP